MHTPNRTNQDYRGRNVTVMGLGTFGGGTAAARFLLDRGAIVTITDQRHEADLAGALGELSARENVRFFWGGHPDTAFSDCDLLVVNPAVRPKHPAVVSCRSRNVPVTTEIGLLLDHIDAFVIAVTGSNGKSTTATLIRDLLQAAAEARGGRVWLGGNIGGSLLPFVDQMGEADDVVLELSSFQLAALGQSEFAPDIAVLTNFTPNHLDWHETLEDYHAAKQILFNRQQRTQVAIVPAEIAVKGTMLADVDLMPWRIRGHCLRFGLVDEGEDGAFYEDGNLILRHAGQEDAIRLSMPPLLPGRHNLGNVCAAACAAWLAGADPVAFPQSLATYAGLPHRQQLVAEGRGLRFVNDSNATTPESTIAALQTFSSRVVVMVGGSDKGADSAQLCEILHQTASAVILMGEVAGRLERQLARKASSATPTVAASADFSEAFARAVELAPAGGIVLLSPGYASYGWFRDYRDRGEQFTELARAWVTGTT